MEALFFMPKRHLLIAVFAGGALSGIILSQNYWQVSFGMLAAAAIGAGVTFRTRAGVLGILAFGLALGIYRGETALLEHQRLQSLFGNKITLTGNVADDPVRTDKGHLQFTVTGIELEGVKLPGEIRVRSHWAKLQREYRIEATGKLEPTVGRQLAEFGFAQIKVVSSYQSPLELWRQKFIAGMRNALPDPQASLGLGLLIGTRALLPKVWQEKLSAAGLTHIVAVSGYNLTILTAAASRLLKGRSRFLALALPLWLIAGFALLTGFSASITRAALVSSLLLFIAHYGRRAQPLTVIALPAAVTALIKPDYLLRDLGWQLSFLAFAGILILAPAIKGRFMKRPNAIKELAIDSLSAQIMTLPLILSIFGELPNAAPLANLLVLPLIPVAMLVTFLAGVAGTLVPPASAILGLPANWLLTYILWLSDFLGRSLPTEAVALTAAQTITVYGLIIGLITVMSRRKASGPRLTAGLIPDS